MSNGDEIILYGRSIRAPAKMKRRRTASVREMQPPDLPPGDCEGINGAAEYTFSGKGELLWLATIVTAHPCLADRSIEDAARLAASSVGQLPSKLAAQWHRKLLLRCALEQVKSQIEQHAQSLQDVPSRLLEALPSIASASLRLERLCLSDVTEALLRLNDLMRNAYLLRVLERLSREECCRLLNVSLTSLSTIEQTAILEFSARLLNDVLR